MENIIEMDPLQTERLILSNGDILPGNLLSLDTNRIGYKGLAGGELDLARKDITMLRFGIKPQVLLYQGPAPLDEWTGSGVHGWSPHSDNIEGVLILDRGKIERNINFGDQFILQFDLKWQQGDPAVRIYFGGESTTEKDHDRYYIDLSNAGLHIRREQSVGPKYNTLFGPTQPEAFDDNHVSMELRVNRLIGTIDLYLDGELIRQMPDSGPPTKGKHLIIERSRNDDSASHLSNLKVYSWDAISQIELLEKPGDEEADSLVDAEGKRMSGKILRLSSEKETLEEGAEDLDRNKKPSAPYFSLQSPFAEEPIKIPSEKTRVIFFQGTEKRDTTSDYPKYELLLANDGFVSAKSISLLGDEFTIQHPIIGELLLDRSIVHSIRFVNEPVEEKDEDE